MLFPFRLRTAPQRKALLDTLDEARAPFEVAHSGHAQAILLAVGEAVATVYPTGGALAAESKALEDGALWTAFYEDLYAEVWPHFAGRVFAGFKHGTRRLETKKTVTDEIEDAWRIEAGLWVEAEAGALIAGIQDATLTQVRAIIAASIQDGLSVADTVARIRDVWPNIAAYRARRIARTEVITASNAGSQGGARTLGLKTGLVLEKVWMAESDARESHGEANGQRRPLDNPYNVGGYEAMYPADASLPAAERVNCRCAEYYEVEGDEAQDG